LFSAPTIYRSPLRLIGHAGEQVKPFSRSAIDRAFQYFEQEIAKNETVVIDGLSYTHADIVSMQQLDADSWYYHGVIYAHEGLLHFLEQNIFDDSLLNKAAQFHFNPGFVRFVSPWFARSFNEVSNKYIDENDFQLLGQLLNYNGFILPAHIPLAFNHISNYLERLKETLAAVDWKTYSADESVFDFIFSSTWIYFINRLPPDFLTAKDAIARAMLRLVLDFQQKATWYFLHELCMRLQKIECSASCQLEVNEQTEKIYKHRQAEEKTANRSERKQQIVWGSGAIGLTLLVCAVIYFIGPRHEAPIESKIEEPPVVLSGDASVSEQLSSSLNEQNLKLFLSRLCFEKYSGTENEIENGKTPFDGVSALPAELGPTPLTISNSSGKDAVVFYFTDKNVLTSEDSRVISVYIRDGESYTMHIDPNFGRLNIAFGKNWVRLKNPKEFPLLNSVNEGDETYGGQQTIGAWKFRSFFATPASPFYLQHNINIVTDEAPPVSSAGVPSATLIFAPAIADLYRRQRDYRVELQLKQEAGKIKIEGRGNLYVYQSPEIFPITDLFHQPGL
jgi:hypothetical protein